MSKMKRKWLRVIEYDETGRPIDEITRQSLIETHPELPILHDQAAMPVEGDEDAQLPPPPPPAPMTQVRMAPQAMMQPHPYPMPHEHLHLEPQIDSQLEQQIQREIASAEPQRV